MSATMGNNVVSFDELIGTGELWEIDTSAVHFLYPVQFRHSDNTLYVDCLKRELRIAIKDDLTENQRFCIREYYGHGRKLYEIARELGVTDSTVSKWMNAAETKLRERLERFSGMYKRIERSVCILYC